MPLIILTLFAVLTAENPMAEPARAILAQHCGQCHLPNLPTSVPRALAVFNLIDEPWYGRMTHDQLDSLQLRLKAVRGLPDADRAIILGFVLCARDGSCPAADAGLASPPAEP